MSFSKKLERLIEPICIPNITLYLVIGQTFVYLAALLGKINLNTIVFIPQLALEGEPWRILTFLFVPPDAHWLLYAFAIYFFYMMGSTLEAHWGTAKYHLFLLSGYLLTVGVAFLSPHAAATNYFIGGAIFLAFAYLFPDFEILLYFILPVRIKWIALITWVLFAYSFFTGQWPTRFAILASVGNFLLFFARDLILDLRHGHRRHRAKAQRIAEDSNPTHRHCCHVCGKTDLTNPELEFRYSADDHCYCTEHLPKRNAEPAPSERNPS